MGSALSTGGGLTESQKKRAKIMNISNSDMLQMMLNKQKIETKLIKTTARANEQTTTTKPVVTKKKKEEKLRYQRKRY